MFKEWVDGDGYGGVFSCRSRRFLRQKWCRKEEGEDEEGGEDARHDGNCLFVNLSIVPFYCCRLLPTVDAGHLHVRECEDLSPTTS